MGDPAFKARVKAKGDRIFKRIEASEGKADPDGKLEGSLDLTKVIAALTGQLAVVEVHFDELHDRILTLEGRSDEKPDRMDGLETDA